MYVYCLPQMPSSAVERPKDMKPPEQGHSLLILRGGKPQVAKARLPVRLQGRWRACGERVVRAASRPSGAPWEQEGGLALGAAGTTSRTGWGVGSGDKAGECSSLDYLCICPRTRARARHLPPKKPAVGVGRRRRKRSSHGISGAFRPRSPSEFSRYYLISVSRCPSEIG